MIVKWLYIAQLLQTIEWDIVFTAMLAHTPLSPVDQ